jgi:nucleoside-diphosphate-sugar epimerase
MHSPRLFCFGLGYSAGFLARRLMAAGWRIAGTCQSPETRSALEAEGIEAFVFDRGRPLADPEVALAGTTHLLSSVPPDADGDSVLDHHGDLIAGLDTLTWAGYLSTTGVYGHTGGARVDESAPLAPTSKRGERRQGAETGWLELRGIPVHVFRLAGIYGPGRNVLDKVRNGTARRIHKPGHRFGRIHVDDIAAVLHASMERPDPGAVYNVCDDEPAAPAEVVTFACELLGMEPRPLVSFDEAKAVMSPMALSFWRDNRLVDNARIKRDLGITLKYPDFRTGLRACLAAETRSASEDSRR